MQLLVLAATLLSLSAAVLAQSTALFNTTISYDRTYDNGNLSTTAIACSDGLNGVITNERAMTLSEIIGWPNISGAPAISSWDSPACRSCWELTFNDTVLHVVAVDVASGGFNVGFDVLNNLTHGNALDFGRVSATARRVGSEACEQGQAGKKLPTPHSHPQTSEASGS